MKAVCMVVQGYYESDIRVRRKAEALVANGYRVDALALRSPSSEAATFVLNGVNVQTLALGKERGSLARYAFEYLAFFAWVSMKLPGLIRRHRHAVVEINTLPDFLIFAALPARFMGAKLVLDMHEITPEFYMSKYGIAENTLVIRTLTWIERISMRFADHVITINEPIQALLESRGLDPSRSTVLMNSADDSLFVESPAASSLEGNSGGFVFMYHGTLTRIYGLDLAIEAFASASEQMPGAEFWILGGGTERMALEAQAAQLGIASRVRLVGTVAPQEVHSWLRRAGAGVLATRQDVFLDYSFSNKLSEYVIMGKPIIASRLRTINHYFSDRALAYFSPGDTHDLAARMVDIYRHDKLRARLAAQARLELHPIRWDVMKARYLGLIDSLVDG